MRGREHYQLLTEFIIKLGESARSNLSIDKITAEAREGIARILNAEQCYIFWCECDGLTMRHEGKDLSVGEGLETDVADRGRAVNIKDVMLEKRRPAVGAFDNICVHSCLCVPIPDRFGGIMGVIEAVNKGEYFTQEDESILRTLALQVAMVREYHIAMLREVRRSMEFSQVNTELEQKVSAINTLYGIDRLVVSAATLDDLLTGVFKSCLDLVSARVACIVLKEEGARRVAFILHRKNGTEKKSSFSFSARANSVSELVIKGAERYVGTSEESVSEYVLEAQGIALRSVVCLPLFSGEEVTATLTIANKVSPGQSEFGESDLKMLTIIAGDLAPALRLHIKRDESEKERRLKTIGKMMSSVMHDIKTPLSVISGYVDLMVTREDEATRRLYAEKVDKQLSNLKRMSKEVLYYAKGTTEVFMRRISVPVMMKNIEDTLRASLENSGIRLNVTVNGEGTMTCDESKIQRSFINLCRNASEALSSYAKQAAIEPEIGITATEQSKAWVFAVEDNGPGIPDEIRHNLFDEFVSYGKENGTGLGLPIVRKAIVSHNGTIRFEDIKPHGTRFIIEIPKECEALQSLVSVPAVQKKHNID